jgi:transcriptional regulator with XRE-family HTH domain
MKSNSGAFGRLIKSYRKRAGVTQLEIAARMQLLDCGHSCNNTAISNWERDVRLPSELGTVVLIAQVLLLNNEEEKALIETYMAAKQLADLESEHAIRKQLQEMGEHLASLRALWRSTGSR